MRLILDHKMSKIIKLTWLLQKYFEPEVSDLENIRNEENGILIEKNSKTTNLHFLAVI